MECPTCAAVLNTEQGMRQHHTKVHGEALPNRICKGCAVEFYDPKARRRFCDDCNPNAGEHNGNWRDATETASCTDCGSVFEYYPSERPGVYCSECVEQADTFLGTPYYEYHDIERELAHALDNVICLCRSCHRYAEIGQIEGLSSPARDENNNS